jgi:hypothetical protein
MKYFEVHKEELRGSLMSGQVYSDGEYSEEATELELRTITTGYSVYEYDENGVREDTEFFPVKTDMTNYPKTGNPAPITAKEAAYVTKWFQENPGLSEVGKDWTNFYVQFVSGDQTNKKGIWHRHDINPQPEGRDWDEDFTDNGGMDKLHVGATQDQNTTDHILDFNAKTGGPWSVAYVQNGSALQWGYHSSWGEDNKAPNGDGYYWYFKMADIEVPGDCFEDGVARTGCYVGLSLYGAKWDNGEKILGYQRLQYAEDWILKITNDTKPFYRVIAEDLNASEKSDFDFNDVVFDVVKAENNKTTLKLIACGGIYKLTVGGVEVHGVFGEAAKADGTYPMINTGKGPEYEPKEFQIAGEYKTPADIKNISIIVYKPGNENGIELTATKGKPACKVLVDDAFDVIPENKDISNEYGNFTNYVQGKFDGDFWWKKD